MTPATQRAVAERLPALRSSTYRRFMAGAFVGSTGAWMQTTAMGWLVLQLTDSPALLGVAGAAGMLPILLLSLHAGVLADRLDRRRLLITTQLLGAVVAATLAALTTTGLVAFWHVVLLALLGGGVQAFANPAFMATIGSLVERAALGNAIGLNSAQFNLSRMLGPTLAAVAITLGGLAVAFWANTLSFLIVALVLATLPIARSEPAAARSSSVTRNLRDGLAYVGGNPEIAVLVLLAAVPGLFVLNYLALMPVYARDVLGIGVAGLGLLNAALGIGALGGALWVALFRPSGATGRTVVAGLAAAGGALAVFALSGWLPLSLVALATLGFAQVAYYATTNTLLQTLVPDELRGRVISLYVMTSLGVIPLGNLMAGLVAERFSAPIALAGGGLLTVTLLGATALMRPSLRRVTAEAAPSAAG